MPPRNDVPDLVRIVEGVEGSVPVRSELVLRFDYGRIVPWVQRADGAHLAVAGPDAVRFDTPIEAHGENLTTVSEFTVEPGQRVPFVLTWFPSHRPPPAAVDAEQALEEATSYWRTWSARCTYGGRHGEAVRQSLRVLKALTFAPTGGIVAAPTTSLPEWIGGSGTGTTATAGSATRR